MNIFKKLFETSDNISDALKLSSTALEVGDELDILEESIKDGVLGSETVLNSVRKNRTPVLVRGDNTPVSQKLDEAQSLLNAFVDSGASNLSKENVEAAMKKVHIFSNDEWESFLKSKGKKLNIGAYVENGEVFLPADICTGSIVHEVLHNLGSVNRPFIEGYREINEAFTDYIANLISNQTNVSKYIENVAAFNDIDSLLKTIGYEHVTLETYFGKKKDYFKIVMDAIGGNGYYDTLAVNMYNAVWGNGAVKANAIDSVHNLVNIFYKKVFTNS